MSLSPFIIIIVRVVYALSRIFFGRRIMIWGANTGWIPFLVRVSCIAAQFRAWIPEARAVVETPKNEGPIHARLLEACRIYSTITKLGIPTPLIQYKSLGPIEPIHEALNRAIEYLATFMAIVDEGRFGKALRSDSEEYLGVISSDQRTKYLFKKAAEGVQGDV